MAQNLKLFGNLAQRLGRSPLGIIALFLLLVYGMAALVVGFSNLDSDLQKIFVWFLVLFPVFVLITFYLLVTKHHDKLYAPSDFTDESYFVRILEAGLDRSTKFKNLEDITKKIQKQIDEQPIFRYTKLVEAGKILILSVKKEKSIDLVDFSKERDLSLEKLEKQAQILSEDFGWITKEGNEIKITERGKEDLSTFQEFVYGRYGKP